MWIILFSLTHSCILPHPSHSFQTFVYIGPQTKASKVHQPSREMARLSKARLTTKCPKYPELTTERHMSAAHGLWFGIFLPTVTVGCRGCKGCFWSNPSIQDPSTYHHFQLTPQGRMAIQMTKTQSWSITYIEKHTDYCWFYWISEDPPIK